MDTLSNLEMTDHDPPFSAEEDLDAFRDEVLHHLADLPFREGAPISRCLWLIFLLSWRDAFTRTVLPVDDRLDLPDPDDIATWCDLMAFLMERPEPGTAQKLVVLRRPGTSTTGISEADAYIYRTLREATDRHDAGLWSFYVTGPDGVWEVSESVRRGRKAFSLLRT